MSQRRSAKLSDPEADDIAQSFRPSNRPVLIAVVVNVSVALLALGGPYLRGHLQGRQAKASFADFAACLLHGKPALEPGLGLPRGELDRFAEQVMFGPDDWPAKCREDLLAVAPEEATFLWPSVKQASADLQAVVELFDSELSALVEARQAGPGRVPARPMAVLSKLRAALTLMSRASGNDEALERNAITFEGDTTMVQATRLPLVADVNAVLELWPGSDGLEAIAVDRRGLSWMRLEGGKIDRRRARRPGLVRAALRSGDTAYVVWAMPAEQCTDRPGGCIKRTTGIAAFDKGADVLPRPVWLAGHPAGRIDRVMGVFGERRIELLSRSSLEGGLVLRRFELPTNVMEGAPPLSPVFQHQATDAPVADALLLTGDDLQSTYLMAVESEGDIQLSLELADQQQSIRVATLPGQAGNNAWVDACQAGDVRWLLGGSHEQVVVARRSADGELLLSAAMDIAQPAVHHAVNPALDRLRVMCTAEDLRLLMMDADNNLLSLRCNLAAQCTAPTRIAENVQRFDALAAGDHTLVALSGDFDHAQIRVLRLDSSGKPGAAVIPAACWAPRGGLCGQPTLLRAGQRILLGAREGTDLLMLESMDGGASWQPMSGLKVGTAISTDVATPMDQHKKRKGIP